MRCPQAAPAGTAIAPHHGEEGAADPGLGPLGGLVGGGLALGHQGAPGPAPPGLFQGPQGMMTTAGEVTLRISEDDPVLDLRELECTRL